MGLLTYSSNNSGGNWWLTDSDWYALEEAGWKIDWYADKKESYYGERWLGALAGYASKEFDSAEEGVLEWESLTGQNAASIGCNCCGPPHSFTFDTGDDVQFISPEMPEYGELNY